MCIANCYIHIHVLHALDLDVLASNTVRSIFTCQGSVMLLCLIFIYDHTCTNETCNYCKQCQDLIKIQQYYHHLICNNIKNISYCSKRLVYHTLVDTIWHTMQLKNKCVHKMQECK